MSNNGTDSFNPPRKRTTLCRLCNEPIYFDNEVVGPKTGKLIPLDTVTEEPHNCKVREEQQQRRYIKCIKCSKDIYFDSNFMSKSGKYIPLSKSTAEPHNCDDDGDIEKKL